MYYFRRVIVFHDTHDLSSTHQNPISELIARFLAAHEGKNSSEVARAIGVDASLVSRWRSGKLPGRLHEATRKRLVELMGSPEPELPGRVSEAPSRYEVESRDRLLGRLDQLRGLVRWAVAEQVEIGARLRALGDELPPSPSADEVEAGAAVLESLPAQQSRKPSKNRKRA